MAARAPRLERAPAPLEALRRGAARVGRSSATRAALIALALGGCGGGEAAPAPASSGAATHAAPTTTTAAPSRTAMPSPTDLVGLDDPPPVPDSVVPAGPLSAVTAPTHGCVLAAEGAQPVLEGASAADVALEEGAFVVAAYAGAPESLRLARVAPGASPTPLGSLDLAAAGDAAHRAAPPVVTRLDEAHMGVVAIDGAGGVVLVRFERGALAPAMQSVSVASSGADARYPAAIAQVDAGTLVAWTAPSGTSAHVRVACVDAAGVVGEVRDVTPEAGTAAAPVFAADGRLYFVDARAGISVVHRIVFGPSGEPGAASVAQPLNLAGEPPSFAVVDGRLGYTAVGNGATRAVGIVTIGSADRALPLVPGLGYGDPISIDAVPLEGAALFAMEAPSAAEASAPHETRMRVVLGDVIGDPLIVAGLLSPRIAVGPGGIVALTGRGASVRWARCAR